MSVTLASPTERAARRAAREKELEDADDDGFDNVDNFAILLINDALDNETGFYYTNEDGVAASIWQVSDEARRTGLFIRQDWFKTLCSGLAIFDMCLACISSPGWDDAPDDTPTVAMVLSVFIWIFFCVLLVIRLKYMWPQRKNWEQAGEEPLWSMGQMFVLFFVTPIHFLIEASGGQNDIPQLDGTSMSCPVWTIFAVGWCRAFVFVYFNQSVRDATVTMLSVCLKLGPFIGFSSCIFVAHYFFFQALHFSYAPTWSGFGIGGDYGSALYNLFSVLTTENHPDAFMDVVENHNFLGSVCIMSYVLLMGILGQNLLLAVVYGEYCDHLDGEFKKKAELRSSMLDTAFDVVVNNRGHNPEHGFISPSELLHILRQCDSSETPLDLDDGDRLEMIVRLIDNKALTRTESSEKGINMQDGKIDRADFHELQVFYNCPFNLKNLTKTEHRYRLRVEQLETRLMKCNADNHMKGVAAARKELEEMAVLTPKRWAASIPFFYTTAFIYGSYHPLMSWSPWYSKSALCQFHIAYFTFFLIFSIFDSASSDLSEFATQLDLLSAIFQSVFFTCVFLGDMRRWQPYHFLNPNNKRFKENFTNICLLAALWATVLSRCMDDECVGASELTPTTTTTFFFTASKVFLVLNFAVMTPTVRSLLDAVQTTMTSVNPHLGLFVAIYFGFAGMAQAFFCGLVTEAVPNGPGDWCEALPFNGSCGVSDATSTPWGDCKFTGGSYYKSILTYNGFVPSFYSLYVIMIGNNWSTVVNGPIEVTNQRFRWFFLFYIFVVCFVMLNILVGAIVDALSNIHAEKLRFEKGKFDPIEVVCQARVDCTTAPSGKFYGETWELGDISLHDGVRYDMDLCPLFTQSAESVESMKIQKELSRDIDLLEMELDALQGGAPKKTKTEANPLRQLETVDLGPTAATPGAIDPHDDQPVIKWF